MGNAAANTPQTFKNKISPLGEFKLTLTSDGTGNQSNNNVGIMPGPCPLLVQSKLAVYQPDGTHITVSTSISAAAQQATEMAAYLASVGMVFSYLRISTTDTANFGQSLWIGEVPPNGILNPEEIPLTQYRTSIGGGGYDTVLTISDRPFANSKNFFMYISNLKLSTSMTFNFGIAAFSDSITASATH